MTVLLDRIHANAEAISKVGLAAIERAREAGVAAHYMDAEYGDDIIREFPDGRRERMIKSQGGSFVFIQPRK